MGMRLFLLLVAAQKLHTGAYDDSDSGVGTDFMPGSAVGETIRDSGETGQGQRDEEDGVQVGNICPEGRCAVVLAPVLSLMLFVVWLGSLTLTVPDWKRERDYVQECSEALEQVQPVECDSDDIPPTGTWVMTSKLVSTTLSLQFCIDGTFLGEGDGRYGYVQIQNGTFNIVTGEFVWEEVICEESTHNRVISCCKSLLRTLVRGPCILFSPIERVRRHEWRPFARAPRTLCVGRGGKCADGSWHLECNFATLDQAQKWFDWDLLRGEGFFNSVPEKEDQTPPDTPTMEDGVSTKSVRHQSRCQKQVDRCTLRESQAATGGEPFVLGKPRATTINSAGVRNSQQGLGNVRFFSSFAPSDRVGSAGAYASAEQQQSPQPAVQRNDSDCSSDGSFDIAASASKNVAEQVGQVTEIVNKQERRQMTF